MQQGGTDKSETKTDQKTGQKHGLYISKDLAALVEVVFGIFGTALFSIGVTYLQDAQFHWSGLFYMASGAGFWSALVFIHARHRYMDRRLPALKTSLVLTVWIVAFGTLGSSSWWFIAFKDSDSFNIIAGSRIESPSLVTPFVAVASVRNDIVLFPIVILQYVQITNKQQRSTQVVGVSLDGAADSRWSRWQSFCRVGMESHQLGFIIEKTKTLEIFSPEKMLETVTVDKPIAAGATVGGWTAWECAPKKTCDSHRLRMGVSDAAGAVTWQELKPASVEPNLTGSFMKAVASVPINNAIMRSYCNGARL